MMRPGNRSNPSKDGTFGVEKCPVATMTLSNSSVLVWPSSMVCTVTANFPVFSS
jgi:hypothetical protein